MRPLGKVKIKWSPAFAYALGLLATDGNLSSDGRHIVFSSKDYELAEHFKKCFHLNNVIGLKSDKRRGDKKYYRVQFGDIIFYQFLLSIGLHQRKTKTISEVTIPQKYFFDFLRGHLDGDGTFYSYWDPRWKSSFMFYTVFISASKAHIDWIRKKLRDLLNVKGHVCRDGQKKSVWQLKYAKRESFLVLRRIYYSHDAISLTRKRKKIEKALAIEYKHNNNARVVKPENTLA